MHFSRVKIGLFMVLAGFVLSGCSGDDAGTSQAAPPEGGLASDGAPGTSGAGGSAGSAGASGSGGSGRDAGPSGNEDGGSPIGTEGAPCYPGGACNAPLLCLSNLCIRTPNSEAGPECVPLATDASALGMTCQSSTECPDGYTCKEISGVVFMMSCEVLCERDCECPLGHSCQTFADDVTSWLQCEPE